MSEGKSYILTSPVYTVRFENPWASICFFCVAEFDSAWIRAFGYFYTQIQHRR